MNRSVKWQKICLSILCVVLALVLLIMVFATVFIHHILGRISRPNPEDDFTLSPDQLTNAPDEDFDPDVTGPTLLPEDVIISTLPNDSQPEDQEEIINILLVGQDRKPDEGRRHSDTMILCTFNLRSNTVTMTSFMRDTYVYIPDYGKRKMNAAYLAGGFKLLNETLAVNFGIHVDANVAVDFTAFQQVIDRLGGVQIELTKGEANYINKKLGSQRVSAGVQLLDGEEALWYARNRTNTTLDGNNNDFGRTERQRRLLSALIAAYKNQSLPEMMNLMYDILPMVTTNMSNNTIIEYTAQLFPMLSSAQVNTLRIPADGTFSYKTISGVGSCLIPDLQANRQILEDLFQRP